MFVMIFYFFVLGMDFLSYKLVYVYSIGKLIIELKYLKFKWFYFIFSVIFDNGIEEYEGVKFVRYVMLEVNVGKVIFRLCLFVEGKYIFIVYVKEDNLNKFDNVFV